MPSMVSTRSRSSWYASASWTTISAFPLMVRANGLPVFLRRSRSSDVFRLKSLRDRMSLAMSSMRCLTKFASNMMLHPRRRVCQPCGRRDCTGTRTSFGPLALLPARPAHDAETLATIDGRVGRPMPEAENWLREKSDDNGTEPVPRGLVSQWPVPSRLTHNHLRG